MIVTKFSAHRLVGRTHRIAEVTWFNCLWQLLTDLGMSEAEASQFCDDDNNLLELVLRIQSVTGYGVQSAIS
ncbi:MAG: hypothetical protein F6K30_00255 [Cyanothece sp. SIO2G6]|nr:hypothetical protein [Cyanothece sp. SIO2G6]